MRWQIIIAPTAKHALDAIRDRRVRRLLAERIDALREEPEKQGKPLTGELAGFRSVRAVGQRYRVLYRVDGPRVLVVVVSLGPRAEGSKKDVYEVARKLLRLRLIEKV